MRGRADDAEPSLIPAGVAWAVVYRDGGVGPMKSVPCRSREEAERLAAETRRLHPNSGARADWHFPAVEGD
jgi:hypothetical protein